MQNNETEGRTRPLIEKIFLSPDERRLRTGWRLLLHLFILWILTLTLTAGLGFFFVSGGASISQDVFLFMGQLVSTLAVTLSVYIARGYLDQRSFSSLGLPTNRVALLDLAAGLLIALVMITVTFLTLLLAGAIGMNGFGWQGQDFAAWLNGMLTFLFIFILGAWLEELLARGYWLQNLADGLNLFWAVLLSSAIFSVLHLLNPGASVNSVIGIFLAGLFFAYAYLVTRRLWLPISLHFGWNFFLGPVFGLPVSGIETPSLLVTSSMGPQWITGGTFGPEAGLALLPGLILGVVLIYAYSRWQPATENATPIQAAEESLS